jgi:hypothetical protein
MVRGSTHSFSVCLRSTHNCLAAVQHYPPARMCPYAFPSKPDISPDWRWRIPMKNMILAAFAVLSLSVAVVPAFAASTIAGDAKATEAQQLGAQ